GFLEIAAQPAGQLPYASLTGIIQRFVDDLARSEPVAQRVQGGGQFGSDLFGLAFKLLGLTAHCRSSPLRLRRLAPTDRWSRSVSERRLSGGRCRTPADETGQQHGRADDQCDPPASRL